MPPIENLYYDVFPRIVRTHQDALITIRPLFDHCRFDSSQPYQACLLPAEGAPHAPKMPLTPQDGLLRFPCHFEDEQEYVLCIERLVHGEVVFVAEFRLYALQADLFARRPWKGDLHMHSDYSDGKESPAYIAAACRRIGMDFMAVTDHRQYAPSLEAMNAFANVPVDLRIYPGEEVHPPDNSVHIIHFGGRFSVNELFASDTYWDEVQAIEGGLADLPEGNTRYTAASCVWCFNKIRQAGGLGVFCHPYWFTRHRYDVPQSVTDWLLDKQPFDALELIGGYHRFEADSNTLQVARYHEERSRGKRIPIVGVSDSHGCETGDLFGWYYSVVFAPTTDLADLSQAIKELYSVAVEALPGETARAYGPFRLVRYTLFLLREIFPQHDAMCVEEGRQMMAFLAGETQALAALKGFQGGTKKISRHFWQA
jgi:hypothetical protein